MHFCYDHSDGHVRPGSPPYMSLLGFVYPYLAEKNSIITLGSSIDWGQNSSVWTDSDSLFVVADQLIIIAQLSEEKQTGTNTAGSDRTVRISPL